MLRGEIAAPDHYRLPRGKIKGTRSTPYFSTEQELPFTNLLYYNYSHSK